MLFTNRVTGCFERACQSEDADTAVIARSAGCSKRGARSFFPRRISTTNRRSEASTEGTVKPTRLAHSMSSSQTCLNFSSQQVADAPVYTCPSPKSFVMASLTIESSFPSPYDTYRWAALFRSFPFTPMEGFELPGIWSDADEPSPPIPASRLRCRWLPRVPEEYLGAMRMASSIEATTSARRPSESMVPSVSEIGWAVPPDNWPPTLDTYAPKAREAARVAPAS